MANSCLTACLSAQGKLEALFTAYCIEPKNHYLFISDGGDAEENKEHLLRFKVADQFSVELWNEHIILHVCLDQEQQLDDLLQTFPSVLKVPSHRVAPPWL